MFEIRRFLPCEALRAYVDTYYLVEVDCPHGQQLEDLLLPELPNLRFQLTGDWDVDFGSGYEKAPRACLFGFTNAPFRVRVAGKAVLFGAGLKPLGWQALVPLPANRLSDKAQDCTAIWPHKTRLIESIRAGLAGASSGKEMTAAVDEMLLDLKMPVPPVTQKMLTYLEATLADQTDVPITRVDELAEEMGLSVRQVERWTNQLYGCSPKLLLRKHRFLTMLARHGGCGAGDAWIEAADETFYDQSHFIREYKRFTGRSPGQYARQPASLQHAVTHTLGKVKGRTPGRMALKLEANGPSESQDQGRTPRPQTLPEKERSACSILP
ncbi:MAG: helix-turn-helix domain-containing protein [Pseudomonadota bacterium]